MRFLSFLICTTKEVGAIYSNQRTGMRSLAIIHSNIDKETVMTKTTTAQSSPQAQEIFTKEELQALRETIKKSRVKVAETKAQSCAYHR